MDISELKKILKNKNLKDVSISVDIKKAEGHRIFTTDYIDYVIHDDELTLCFHGYSNDEDE